MSRRGKLDVVAATILLLAFEQSESAGATPPEYASFGRAQAADVAIDEGDLLRIWCVYVGQGDGILIQFPEKLAYKPDSAVAEVRERVDILVDAGSYEGKFTREMVNFLHHQGARPKALGSNTAREHPWPDVIGWLGGAHRVYLTQLHERRSEWSDIDTKSALLDLEETTHVLIETDGNWFRVVELDTRAASQRHATDPLPSKPNADSPEGQDRKSGGSSK